MNKDKARPAIPRKPTYLSKSKVTACSAKPESAKFLPMAHSAIPSRPAGSKPAAPKKPTRLQGLPIGSRPPSLVVSSQLSPPERQVAVFLQGQPPTENSVQAKDDQVSVFPRRFPSPNSTAVEVITSLRTRGQRLWEFLSAVAQKELIPAQFASALQNLTYNDKYVMNYEFNDVGKL